MIKNLTEREKNIFVMMIIAVVIFISTQFMIGPLQAEIDAFNQSIDEKIQQYKKEVKNIKKSRKVESEYLFYQNTFLQNKSDEETLADFLSQIEKVSSQEKLPLTDLKPNKIRKELSFNEFSASLTLQSEYADVMELISILQREPYLFNVDEVKIESISRKDNGLVRTRLNLSKIYIPL